MPKKTSKRTYRPGRKRYKITKAPCTQSRGKRGKYVMSFIDHNGIERKACHTSLKKAKRQIVKIDRWLKNKLKNEQYVREFVRNVLHESIT